MIGGFFLGVWLGGFVYQLTLEISCGLFDAASIPMSIGWPFVLIDMLMFTGEDP